MFTWGNMEKRASSYFNIQFETQIEQTVFGLCRNTAFFTEAPKYGLILSIAYIFNYMFEGDKRIAMLLFATIVSTFSFTAIIAIILLHFIEYSMNVGKDVLSQKARFRTIIWPIVIGIVLIIAFFLMSNKLDTSSGAGRVGDFVVCFSVGLKHPLFGWGFMDNEYLNTVLHTSRLASGVGNTMGLSNSICQIFVDGGLYMLLFYLFQLMALILFGKKHNKKVFSVGLGSDVHCQLRQIQIRTNPGGGCDPSCIQHFPDHCHGKVVCCHVVVVDHIIPHRGDQKLFWDQNNWQSLCKSCHDKKTLTEDINPTYTY